MPKTKPIVSLSWSGHTDIGRARKNNEDAFLGLSIDATEVHFLGKLGDAKNPQTDYLFAVSDGMGGAMAGEFASRIAIEKITRLLPPYIKKESKKIPKKYNHLLEELFAEIHRALLFLGSSYEECRGMGATLSLCWIRPSVIYFAHIGDSRIYHLPKDGGIRQLSEDDTHVGWLFRTGALNEREAKNHPRRNLLQKALGAEHQFATPQVGSLLYQPNDRILLCTDGVTDGIFDEQLLEILNTPAVEFSGTATISQHLVKEAVLRSGRDNATAMLIEMR
ncbi:MAG: PP2C family protein-serine/threonine phosphatase [Chthoniobacterales bacterium]